MFTAKVLLALLPLALILFWGAEHFPWAHWNGRAAHWKRLGAAFGLMAAASAAYFLALALLGMRPGQFRHRE